MAEDIKDLKEALDESSKHNRRVYSLFLVLLVYTLVTVASTTDILLLVPNSNVRLPIVNVEMPLIGFYILVPLFIIIFHFNLLFNLFQHSVKLFKWDEKREDKDNFLIFPFIFNFTVKYKKKNIYYYLLKIVLWITIYFFPLLILLFIQLKFSAYHSLKMTIWHVTALMIDIFLIFIFWHRIIQPELSVEDYDSFKSLIPFHKDRGLLKPFVKIFYLLKGGVYLFLSFKFIIRIIKFPIAIIRRISTLHDSGELFSMMKHLIAGFESFSLWIIVLISYVNLTILILLPRLDSDFAFRFRFIIPKLELSEKTLVATPPSEEVKQRYIAIGKTENEAWLKHANGLNLKGRDLEFAVLIRTKLFGADLRGAKLRGADLSEAQLHGAMLSETQLQGANLWRSQLQGVDLSDAQLQGADLCEAQLQGANLWKAQLQGANLWRSQLQGVNLSDAQLQGADLSEAQLQGANLSGAQLQGADLMKSKLQGANLWNSQLQGADLIEAQLQGADISAQLQGANLWKAQLQGTNLSNAQLQGANVSESYFQGADLSGAQLQGAYLENAKLLGSNIVQAYLDGILFKKIDLKTEVNWEKILQLETLIPKETFFRMPRSFFRERITKVKARWDEIKKQDPKITSDRKKFFETRKQLACENINTVEGMLKQYYFIDDRTTKEIKKTIIEQMKNKCPQILEEVKERSPQIISSYLN